MRRRLQRVGRHERAHGVDLCILIDELRLEERMNVGGRVVVGVRVVAPAVEVDRDVERLTPVAHEVTPITDVAQGQRFAQRAIARVLIANRLAAGMHGEIVVDPPNREVFAHPLVAVDDRIRQIARAEQIGIGGG